MKLRTYASITALTLLLVCALCTTKAQAQIYSSGPTTANENAFAISGVDSVSDTFTVAAPAFGLGVNFILWTPAVDSLTSLTWSIETNPLNNPVVYGSGTATTFKQTTLSASNSESFAVESALFSIGAVPLVTGKTYYLTLSDATTANGDAVFWDENDGTSTGYQNDGTKTTKLAGGETFSIFAAPTPESSTVVGFALSSVLLFGFVTLRKRPALGSIV